MLEKNGKKICWDFEFTMRKATSARKPDVIIENDEGKKLWIVDMACPNEKNIGEKHREKLTKYQQLAFEMREKRPEYRAENSTHCDWLFGRRNEASGMSDEIDYKGRRRSKMDM